MCDNGPLRAKRSETTKRSRIHVLKHNASYQHYTPYNAHNIMSPENTHKVMGFYMEVIIY